MSLTVAKPVFHAILAEIFGGESKGAACTGVETVANIPKAIIKANASDFCWHLFLVVISNSSNDISS